MSDVFEKPSRSQLKREAEAMQKLGEELLELNESALATLDLTDELREAIRVAHTIKSNVAHKRQRQYIGKLIRALDGEKIAQQLSHLHQASKAHIWIEHWVEEMVDRLVAGDEGVYDEIALSLPNIDHQYFRQLIRNMNKELKEEMERSKTRRIIFRYLRELMQNIRLTNN